MKAAADRRPATPSRGSSGIRVARRVVAELARRHEEVVAELSAAVLKDFPEYQAVQDPALVEDFRTAVDEGLRLFCDWLLAPEDSFDQRDADFFRIIAARRADQLVSLDEFVRASSASLRFMWAWLERDAGDTPEGREAALLLVRRLFEWHTVAIEGAVQSYMVDKEKSANGRDHASRDVLEDLLAGRFPLREGVAGALFALGFEPDADYVVAVTVSAPAGRSSATHDLARAAEALKRELRTQRHNPLVVFRHEELVAVVPDESIPMLVALIDELRLRLSRLGGPDLLCGISTVCHGLEEVQRGYDEAHRALRLARSGREGAVVALSRASLVDYLISQADGTAHRIVPPEVHRLLEEDTKLAGALLATLRAYVRADLNVGRAAADLVVHANTVHYRLKRVSEITGRSTRSFNDLVDLLCGVEILWQGNGAEPAAPLATEPA